MMIHYKNKTLAVFADTHGQHQKIALQPADIAIHLGDACSGGNDAELFDFLQWFSQYPVKHKIFVAGNHELQWELEPENFLEMFPRNIIFLENTKLYLEGIYFVSVTARPWLHAKPNLRLPQKTDFLLTHAPPKGILDNGLGCPILTKFVEKVNPDYHLFGHIHETSGQTIQKNKTTFINVGIV